MFTKFLWILTFLRFFLARFLILLKMRFSCFLEVCLSIYLRTLKITLKVCFLRAIHERITKFHNFNFLISTSPFPTCYSVIIYTVTSWDQKVEVVKFCDAFKLLWTNWGPASCWNLKINIQKVIWELLSVHLSSNFSTIRGHQLWEFFREIFS